MSFGTIHVAGNFDDEVASESLERAMRNKEKQRVVDILVHICNSQRQMIRTPYKVRYGKDLEDELKKTLNGELEEVIVALVQTPTKLDVLELHRAVKGLGTNEKVLIEILVSRTNEEMEAIRNCYFTTYGKSLEDAVSSDTSGDFRRLLLILIQGRKDETERTVIFRAQEDAQHMVKSLEKKSGIDKFDAFKVLGTSNAHHVRHVSSEFERLTGTPLEKAIEKEYSGDMRNLLQALLLVSHGKPRFFANQIHLATKGLGTRDKDLIRVLVGRSEIDLAQIVELYHVFYKKSLYELIKEECKGGYRDALMTIIKGNRIH
ncbi:unnamed protein product [Auanema sp. JU1783]|nr:unnamed protein product [Auanema sp. JU1783]